MRRYLLPAVFAFAMAAQDEPETIRTQSRSMTMTRYGVVATSQTLAFRRGSEDSRSGRKCSRRRYRCQRRSGPHEPGSNGIGGDLFAIIYEAKTGKLYGLNSSGWAPAGLSIDLLRAAGETTMPQRGIHAVTVPGAVAGWDAMHKRFGRLPLSRLLTPAIYYGGRLSGDGDHCRFLGK